MGLSEASEHELHCKKLRAPRYTHAKNAGWPPMGGGCRWQGRHCAQRRAHVGMLSRRAWAGWPKGPNSWHRDDLHEIGVPRALLLRAMHADSDIPGFRDAH